MSGINLNRPITYRHASLRFFEPGEYHITRLCSEDVLLLVYEGVLRFREDGIDRQVRAGEYYIQKAGLFQEGITPSESPKYLYVHFRAEWSDGDGTLPRTGRFQYLHLKSLMERMDRTAHDQHTYVEQARCFYELLELLYQGHKVDTVANQIAAYLTDSYLQNVSLDTLCEQFHYSKNHIINLFRQEYRMTPIEYLNEVRLRRAMYLLEVTSHTIEDIAAESGFHNYSHFYRLFCRKTGISPVQWRKNILLQPTQYYKTQSPAAE